MLSLSTIFAGAFVVGLPGAMAPGPVLTVTISETLKRGHILSDLAWLSFVSFSVSAGRRLCPPLLYRIVFILCGTMLICLGSIFVAKVLLR